MIVSHLCIDCTFVAILFDDIGSSRFVARPAVPGRLPVGLPGSRFGRSAGPVRSGCARLKAGRVTPVFSGRAGAGGSGPGGRLRPAGGPGRRVPASSCPPAWRASRRRPLDGCCRGRNRARTSYVQRIRNDLWKRLRKRIRGSACGKPVENHRPACSRLSGTAAAMHGGGGAGHGPRRAGRAVASLDRPGGSVPQRGRPVLPPSPGSWMDAGSGNRTVAGTGAGDRDRRGRRNRRRQGRPRGRGIPRGRAAGRRRPAGRAPGHPPPSGPRFRTWRPPRPPRPPPPAGSAACRRCGKSPWTGARS